MTQCTQTTIPFASLKTPRRRKRIEADFAGGRLTSDAGVLLLREIDKRLGLTEAIARCIPDPRDPRFTIHEQKEMLAQRIYTIALGYEDLNDHDTLRHDAALQVAAERVREDEDDQALSSPPTLCRLENRVERQPMVSRRSASSMAIMTRTATCPCMCSVAISCWCPTLDRAILMRRCTAVQF